MQALCITGAVRYSAALPIIMGQNIGTCVTALLSGIGASNNARRASLMHLYFNLIGTIVFMIAFYAINAVVPFAFLDDVASAAGIAVVHTAFNVIATVCWLPFSRLLVWLVMQTIRDDEQVEKIDDFQLLDERFLATPGLAVEQCRVVARRMAELTREAIFEALRVVDERAYTEEVAERITALEKKIDHYEDNLGTYMVKLSRARLSKADGQTLSVLLHSISDFERISDHAVNLLKAAQEMAEKKMTFSENAARELHIFAKAVHDIVERSVNCFLENDAILAKSVEPLEECIDDMNVTIKGRHIERLTAGECTIELGFVLTDICTDFERVADHCSNIAIYQIQVPNDEYDTHEYLHNMRRMDREEFDQEEMRYEELYRLPDRA